MSTSVAAVRAAFSHTHRVWPILLCVPAMAVALTPLVYLAIRTSQAGFDRIGSELLTSRVAALAVRSLALAVVVTAACVVLGVATAVVTTRTTLPGRGIWSVVVALPLAVPTYVAGFAWIATVPQFEGFWAAALVLTLCSYPYVHLPVSAALRGVDPAQEEVSRALGRGPWRTFTAVTIRQIRPAVASGALLVALYVLSDFGAVSILRYDTFTRAIFTAFNLGFDRTAALVLATVLVGLTVVVLLGEEFTRRAAGARARYARLGAGTSRPPNRVSLGASRLPAMGMLVVLAGLSLGVPALSLVRWNLAGVSDPEPLADVMSAAAASVSLSAFGAGLTLVLALPAGLYVAHRSGLLATIIERTAYLGHALPGLVVGLSLVFFGINVAYPLYQTPALLAFGYAVLFLPLALAAVRSAAAQSPPALAEVARSLGRSPMAVLRTVTLPLAAPGIGAGAALVFLTCMKELPATLLLRPTGVDTLATELWTQTSVSAYSGAAPYAALLVLLSAIPAWLLAWRTRSI